MLINLIGIANFGAKYERSKKSVVLDNKVFEKCKIKMIEQGLLSKSHTFVHFDGERWNILLMDLKKGTINNFKIE